ncbi:uncharacterized protein LOC118283032 isoform X2 [Scophthalmus maximus]|uniref:uncharacterized protein LOC118283032 isoform X2 n=1 Tax=Scophthalmus maximus TaxID=52904 RepID=UPI0015E0DB1B|nr:uncharacterized protein LOC118283032 isoform X2 [Scophthalmus maximus]
MKTMDKLKSEQDRLCMWLSDDPDHILQECGNILSLNEFLAIHKQSSAYEKMRELLKIITEKGGDACQSFFDILRQNQACYPKLQQLFSPNTQGNVIGKVLQADYSAHGGSVICADRISDATIDADVDFSVSVQTSQVYAGTVDETPPSSSSQGPAVNMIIEHKVELIDCLRADHSFILQHVHAGCIVTDRQYQNLKHICLPEKTLTDLIDQVIDNGQISCSLFIEVLKNPEVVRTYPQLKDITRNLC